MKQLLTIWFLIPMLAVPTGARADGKLPADVRAFFGKYCFDCHDNATSKAKFSLESLAPEFQNAAWVRVHDRLHACEMPPVDMPQPKPEEIAPIVKWLSQQLTTATAEKHASEGRVLLRRMIN